ncbi:MAG: enoyl-CoA hydratase/isomerase family protein [Acidimicrobiales bacterium]
MGELVTLEEDVAKGIAIVRIENGKMNPISIQVTNELAEIAEELAARDDIGAVVLWGGPRIFAAGADIKEFPALENAPEAYAFSMGLQEAFLAVENLPQITLSAVNGFALGGGCELSMVTDFRIAGESAVFGQPEVLLGIAPGAGGTQRLMRLVGITKAKEINYTGRQVPAAEALEIGLVSEVVADDACYPRAIELAEKYASGPKSLQYIKRAMMEGLPLPLDQAVEAEARAFADCFETEDRVTGVQSFIESGPGKATFVRR